MMSSQSMNQEYTEAMIFKIFYEQFMNVVQIVQNTYGEYDRDTLALLSMLDENKKYSHVQNIRMAYVVIILDIIDTEALIERNVERINRLRLEGKTVKADRWEEANKYNQLWERKLKGLLTQAKSGYAFFRNLALVESFTQKQKRGGILGVGKDALADMKKQLGTMASKKKSADSSMSPEHAKGLEEATDAGIKAVKEAQASGLLGKDGAIP